MIKKCILGLCLSVGLLPLAHAGLNITNNTDKPSTAVINNGPCSTMLGEHGTTQPHTTNSVPDGIIKLACLIHTSDCKANLYMSDNCSVSVIANIVFDTKKGIRNIDNKNIDGYTVSGSGFDATINKGQ